MLVFFVGTGRCGSTPVVEAICRHPEVGFVSNVDDKLSYLNLSGRWNNALHRRSPPRDPRLRPFRDRRRLFERGRVRLAPSEGWRVLDRQISPMMSTPFRDLGASDRTPWLDRRLHEFFERRMAAQRRPVFVHHLTGWPRVGLLHAVFPQARFVHVVRDGRAVANSWLQMGWWRGYQGPSQWHLGPLAEPEAREWEESGRSFVALAGLGWRILIEALERARAAVPPAQWLETRYEDVIAEPRAQIASVLDFMELDWTAEFENSFTRYPFEARRVDAFRRDLDPANLALLERTLASTLIAYGYDVALSTSGVRIVAEGGP